MKSEAVLLFLLLFPGLYQDLKYREISKEYCLVLIVGSFLYTLGNQITKGSEVKHFAVYFVYVGSLLLVRKYRHFLKGAIGLADVEAILVLSLFLELKYLLLIIVISLLFVVVIGGLLQVLKSKLMYKRFDNELPYIPLLYGSLAAVTWMLYY